MKDEETSFDLPLQMLHSQLWGSMRGLGVTSSDSTSIRLDSNPRVRKCCE